MCFLCRGVALFYYFPRPGFVCRTLVEIMIMTKICFACVHTVSFRSTSLGLKMHNPFGSGRGGGKKAAGGGRGAGGGGDDED
jgi:hypothetical protein